MSLPHPRARRHAPPAANNLKWDELRLKAASEKDPFKLAVILSQMAALAHSEQQQVVQRLKGSVRNYEALKSTRTAELKVQAVAELLQSSPDGPNASAALDSDSVSRFLTLAATALKHKGRTPGDGVH